MRPTLFAVLSFALIAAPAGAQGPCDILAAAINARFEAGTPAATVVYALARGELEDGRIGYAQSRPTRAIARDPTRYHRVEYDVPYLRGMVVLSEMAGTLECQSLTLFRTVDGRRREVANSGIDGVGGACLDAQARPVGIGGKPYLIDVPSPPGQSEAEKDEVRVALHPLSRAGVTARGACSVALRLGPRARIEDLQPTDAASAQARRAAMAALEPAMPRLAQAYGDRYGHLYEFDSLPDAELRRDSGSWLVVRFQVGASSYIARIGPDEMGQDALVTRLSRVWPELGGRERELATFRYARSRAFVRALSRAPDLR